MIWETFIQIIHQLSDFKYLAMIWVFSGNSLFIVRKLKIIYNHFKSLPCHLSLVIYSNGKISYFPIRSEGRYPMTKLMPIKAQSLSKETKKVFPFCEAYLSNSDFKYRRKSSKLIIFSKTLRRLSKGPTSINTSLLNLIYSYFGFLSNLQAFSRGIFFWCFLFL